MELWDCIWVVAAKDRKGQWRKMAKVADGRLCHSAREAFEQLRAMDPQIAKSFGVFEIPITKVCELLSPEEEGKSGNI